MRVRVLDSPFAENAIAEKLSSPFYGPCTCNVTWYTDPLDGKFEGRSEDTLLLRFEGGIQFSHGDEVLWRLVLSKLPEKQKRHIPTLQQK